LAAVDYEFGEMNVEAEALRFERVGGPDARIATNSSYSIN